MEFPDYARNYLALQKKGHDWWACCPFHGEKTASFHITKKSGSDWFGKCFGCGWSGDLIQFKMDYHNITFLQAKEELGLLPPKEVISVKASSHSLELAHSSMQYPNGRYRPLNNLYKYFCTKFPQERVFETFLRYHIGSSKKWPGATIFWYMDWNWTVRAGKIMLYSADGKRVKEPYAHITWVHKVLGISDFNLRLPLFGEHRLESGEWSHKKVANIVESEKTALWMSLKEGGIWLACGGLSMLNKKRLEVIRWNNIILHPDAGAYDQWRIKATELRMEGFNVTVSRQLTGEPKGTDYADL